MDFLSELVRNPEGATPDQVRRLAGALRGILVALRHAELEVRDMGEADQAWDSAALDAVWYGGPSVMPNPDGTVEDARA